MRALWVAADWPIPFPFGARFFSGNAAGFVGGGIDNDHGVLVVNNSDFSANTPQSIYGGFVDGGGNTFS